MTNKLVARDLSYELRRIAELWRFKACKMENNNKEGGLLFFKLDLWQTNFLDAAKNGPFSAGAIGE